VRGDGVTPRIVLVRHGRSAHVHRGWIDRAGLDRWNAAYDAAGIHADDRPPAELRALACAAGRVVASDMPRARASAELLLGSGGQFEVSPLLRELTMWVPPWRRVRLPLVAWSLALALGSYLQMRRGLWPEPEVRARAREAAAWLAGLAREHGTVVAVTHGAFRATITRALVLQGWRAPRRRRYHHWSVWEMASTSG
jgi:broad specificity phosphatase PhoE